MEKHSLSHTSWECVYHIAWTPKYRRKVLYGETRGGETGQTLRMLVDRVDGVEIVEGGACVDHMHVCLRAPPKRALSKVAGMLKGEGAIILHERHPEWRRATGRDRTLWARGRYVNAIGLDEAKVRKCVRGREEASKIE